MVSINEQEKLMTKKLMNNCISGQWLVASVSQVRNPGFLVTKTIKIKLFSNGKVTFVCKDLWFYDDSGNATEIWNANRTEEENSDSIDDFYSVFLERCLAELKVIDSINAIWDGHLVRTNYHNFITGMMTTSKGLKAINEHFGLKPRDMLVSIRKSLPETKERISTRMDLISIDRNFNIN